MITKSRLNNLIRRAEELKAGYIDFLDESNYEDNFILSMLYSYDINNNEEALEFCRANRIHNITDLLEYSAKNIFKT